MGKVDITLSIDQEQIVDNAIDVASKNLGILIYSEFVKPQSEKVIRDLLIDNVALYVERFIESNKDYILDQVVESVSRRMCKSKTINDYVKANI